MTEAAHYGKVTCTVRDAATIVQGKPHGSGKDVAKLVCADIEARVELGRQRYGERLRSHNGRNALWDAYQEQLDSLLYLRQAMDEQEGHVDAATGATGATGESTEVAEESIACRPPHELATDERGFCCAVCGMRADSTQRFPQPYCDGFNVHDLAVSKECRNCEG